MPTRSTPTSGAGRRRAGRPRAAAHAGVVQAALRVAEFDLARDGGREAASPASPEVPEALALYGDALWASGLFEEAEARYRDALASAPDLARGHHGMARALAARSKLDEAMAEAQTALRLSPRDLEIHHTVGVDLRADAQVTKRRPARSPTT